MSSATQSDIPVDRLANAIGTLSPSSEDVASVAAQLCSSITEQKVTVDRVDTTDTVECTPHVYG
jgi:hypothetical protein